jgi:hypothetical protein
LFRLHAAQRQEGACLSPVLGRSRWRGMLGGRAGARRRCEGLARNHVLFTLANVSWPPRIRREGV